MKKNTLINFLRFVLPLTALNSCGGTDATQLQSDNEELIKYLHHYYNMIEYPYSEVFQENGYNSVLIKKTIWMNENLNTSVYSNGDSIPEIKELKKWRNLKKDAWCYYENDPYYGQQFGKLYN